MRKVWKALLGIGFAAGAWAGSPSSDNHRELWLGPQSPPPSPLAHSEDVLQMFVPNAPWKTVAAHIKVFKLYGGYLARAPQSEIDAIVADLKRRRIAIAVETGVLNVDSKPPPPCGGAGIIEGYGTAARAKQISEKIKAAGGEIKYLVMDEPLYYGHFSSKPRTCHSPIAVLLQQLRPTIQAYQQEFPDIVIGEVEPTRLPSYHTWRADLGQWLKGERDLIGRPLAFMQLDIPWTDDGQRLPGTDRPSREPGDAIATYKALQDLKRRHLLGGIGLIFDGTPGDTSDAAWTQDARDHVVLLEGERGLCPDQDVFQSWMPRPSHTLPESRDDTLTGLTRWFLRNQRRCGVL